MSKSTILALAAIAGLTTAQTCGSNFCKQSAPFKLQLESRNQTLNNAYLSSCHSGAAIETLCVTTGNGSTYHFNTSTTASSGYENQGYLNWDLVVNGGNLTVSSALEFSYNPTSNVVTPVLFPGSTGAQILAVTNGTTSYLAVPKSIDDTVVPAVFLTTPVLVQNWYVCQTYYGGYRYTTLAWVVGKGRPQNPSCSAVKVKRVFA